MAGAEDNLELIKKIIQQNNEYHPESELGRGAFGYIYKVIKNTDKNPYALKCIPLLGTADEIEKLKEEANNLFKCSHQNIVRYQDSFEVNVELEPDEYSEFLFSDDDCSQEDVDSFQELLKEVSPKMNKIVSNANNLIEPQNVNFLCIQMELCEKSLRQIIQQNEISDYEVLNGYMKDICKGLQHLHQKELIHRDLKPENILFCEGILKIADFGLSKNIMDEECNRPYLTQCGTAVYQAPELFGNIIVKNNKMIDMYSLGVIFLEMNRQFKTVVELVEAINNVQTENYFDDLPDEYKFILALLDKNPDQRPTCEKVMEHLSGINISKLHLKNYNENRERLLEQFHNDLKLISKVNFENNFLGKIVKTAIEIFELHDGKILKIPCYYPHRLQSLSILNKFCNVVPIADNSRIVFAKYLSKTKPRTQIRRYSISNNLSNNADNMYTCKDNMECTFDIVFPNQNVKRDLQSSLEAEIITIVSDILNEITNSDNCENIVIHINHKAFIRGLLIWEDLNTNENIRNIYNLFRQHTNENLPITNCINKLKELVIGISDDLIALLTNAVRSSQFLPNFEQYLVQNKKIICANSFTKNFQTAYVKMIILKEALQTVGIKDDNIFLNFALLHQCEDSGIMFRVYFKKDEKLIKIAEGGHYENLILNHPKKNYFACGVSLNIEGIDKVAAMNNFPEMEEEERVCLTPMTESRSCYRQMLLLLKELHKHKINAIMSNSKHNKDKVTVQCYHDRIEIFYENNWIDFGNVTLTRTEICSLIQKYISQH